MIGWDRRDDGIVVLTLDDPDRSANTVNAGFIAALGEAVDRLEVERETITGVVVTSGKPGGFLLGMDLKEFTAAGDAAGGDPRSLPALLFELSGRVKRELRRLERLGRPVVAAVNGSALGGGLELPLACHHRIALSDPRIRLGLPEVTLGLLPGGGGVTRVVRMLGVQEALTAVLLQGQRMRPAQARDRGLMDDLADTPEELLAKAVAWIGANPRAAQPWDAAGYRMPGGRPTDRSLAAMLPAFPATLRKRLRGADYPAPRAIMCAAVEGAAVDFDTALRIEGRWFVSLVGTPVQRAMTGAFFFDLNHLNRGGSRPPVGERPPVRRLGVVGAGMMGAGIGYVAALAGMSVTLVDVSAEAAERGREHARGLLDAQVRRGRATAESRDATLARIRPTADLADLAGCDAVIEAVFEDLALKHETFRRLGDIVGADTMIASNTSSLPITALAEAVPHPERFLGLHFFSPVHRMPLVEIVRGRSAVTDDATLARGYDLVRALGMTPIVVNDSRGFFTSRVFGVRVMEAVAMLAEGLPAASVEQAALQAGYPVGCLAVLDEVTLSLGLRLRDEARKAGAPVAAHPGEAVLERMVGEFGRTGKAAGAGFYDYPADGSGKRLWPGLAEHFGPVDVDRARDTFDDMRERLLFAEALESARCVEEQVLTGEADGNIGSIFGIGFPAWTGGVLRYVGGYPGGVPGFAARAHDLASRYGDRFAPPESLLSAR